MRLWRFDVLARHSHPLRAERRLKTLAALLMPVAGRLPFDWIYPTGAKQEERRPRHARLFHWATVIAGDCHYIKRYMPDDMAGKVIVTNTTTPEDVEFFRRAGRKYLLTTTPVLEAARWDEHDGSRPDCRLGAKRRVLTHSEYAELLAQIGFQPQLHSNWLIFDLTLGDVR